MTLLPGEPCSPSDVLRTDVELSERWWSELRRSLHRLASAPTTQITVTQARINGLVRAAFGEHHEFQINHWETVHGDLHWSNLLQPQLGRSHCQLWVAARLLKRIKNSDDFPDLETPLRDHLETLVS